MRFARVDACAAAALLGVLAVATAARAMDMSGGSRRTANVTIEFGDYSPAQLDIVAGDAVTWSDASRRHTVTDANGTWSSPDLFAGDTFTRTFSAAGDYPYVCRIHSFMQGDVHAYDVLLDRPPGPAAAGRPYPLRGRTSLPGGTAVTIQAGSNGGWAPAGSAVVGDDGSFAAAVTPRSTGTFRAVAGSAASPPVTLLVNDRRVIVRAHRHGRREWIIARVVPSEPGATVVLEYRLRERFGWWPEQQARVGRGGSATFAAAAAPGVPARVALTLPDGATVLALSAPIRLP